MNIHRLRSGLPSFVVALFGPGLVLTGCLDRPIERVEPRISGTIHEIVPHSRVDKIDLLLGIDNSASMADKQEILAQAVPDLVRGLVNPPCVDGDDQPLAPSLQPSSPSDACPAGSRREFDPVLDIHIGIVSSSLGGHGGNHCPDIQFDSSCGGVDTSKNDHGQLLSRADACALGSSLPTYEDKGFLAWDPAKQLAPPGEARLGTLDGTEPGLIPALADMVKGVGQHGCGYESQLESIYRFLVDPEPYASISVPDRLIETSGRDEVLLAQRAEFLRPDSLVAILMLSDENDCSIKETGAYFAASDSRAMPRPRAICATDPQDACCTSCSAPAPAGCPADPSCFDDQGNVAVLSNAEDPADLRCFDQKRRFGVDFLYASSRYVEAFSSPTVATRSGELVDNPLFPKARPADGIPAVRTPDLVFVAGIVGVPWQDVARDPQDLGKGFKSARTMAEDGTWDLILGDPAASIPPADPLMHESVEPRTGVHPLTGEPVDRSPDTPLDNSINGHEWNTKGRDLQYACIFDLPTATDCDSDLSCSECGDPASQNPLCDENDSNMLVRAKAYPGLRQLDVLRGLGDQGIVASVCPNQVTHPASPDYGYRPAIGALVDRLKSKIGGPCLSRPLAQDEAEKVNCLLIEARDTGGACACDPAHARISVDPTHDPAIDAHKQRFPDATWDCFCEIPQLEGEPLAACQNDIARDPVTQSGEAVSGFCYVDAMSDPPVGNPSLVAHCHESERRMIRLVGEAEPSPGAALFVTCSGEF